MSGTCRGRGRGQQSAASQAFAEAVPADPMPMDIEPTSPQQQVQQVQQVQQQQHQQHQQQQQQVQQQQQPY